MSSGEVQCKRYEPAYLAGLQTFYLPQEQAQFTALPIEMLEMTPARHPIVILHKGEPVGFFVLHAGDRVKEYTDNPQAMLLAAFSITHSQQGKGFAQKGLEQMKDFVHQEFPGCDEIVLAVNHKNIAAQRLYVKAGFLDTGRRRMGPIGEQFIYHLPLA